MKGEPLSDDELARLALAFCVHEIPMVHDCVDCGRVIVEKDPARLNKRAELRRAKRAATKAMSGKQYMHQGMNRDRRRARGIRTPGHYD